MTENTTAAKIVLGIILFLSIAHTGALTGIGWHVLKSDDTCRESLHTYVKGVTIGATAQLVLYLAALCALILCCSDNVSTFVSGAVFILTALVGNILNLIWFIWGIVLLANHQCEGTIYNTFAIVFVVLSGLGVVGNLCASRAKGA